jgi:hypothetical protein
VRRTNVIEMRAVRDLLAELDKLRSDILAGDVQGWGGVVKHADGQEVVYIGGTFKTSAADRARAMLKVSAVVMREDNYLPPVKTGTGLH